MENFIILRDKFQKIKKMGLIEPLRKGTTGIGYTFETLLNKKEDAECKPDFLGIEIKTKLGYSKSPITLFHSIPKRKGNSAIHYIFNKYSYKKYDNRNNYIFCRELFASNSIKIHNYNFKLFVDFYNMQIVLKSYYNDKFIEDVCYWDFKTLERKLKIKLKYLALVHAYPYRIKGKLYYKYLKMSTYKLKDFFEFLQLIKEDKIFVTIYLKGDDTGLKENHGVAFRIKNEFLEELFTKLNY